jgi:hypothetical protein
MAESLEDIAEAPDICAPKLPVGPERDVAEPPLVPPLLALPVVDDAAAGEIAYIPATRSAKADEPRRADRIEACVRMTDLPNASKTIQNCQELICISAAHVSEHKRLLGGFLCQILDALEVFISDDTNEASARSRPQEDYPADRRQLTFG